MAVALVCGLQAQTGVPGYGGPSVSSRGLRGAGSRSGESVSIRPYANVQGILDNGFVIVGVRQDGRLTNPGALFGVEANVGAYGAKDWKRTRIGLDYNGLYRHYTKNTFYNGSDHLLSMDLVRQLTRRTGLTLRMTAGTSSRPVGGVFSYQFVDPLAFGVPSNDLFDNRAYFLDATGQYTVQIGSKNFLNLGGNGFAIRRQSRALVGVNGTRAYADFTRRISRRNRLGIGYQYMHFDFPRVFGESDINLAMVTFGRQLTRRLDFSVAGGGYRVDLVGVKQITLDPAVAAIIGQTTGRQAFNAINFLPYAQVNLRYSRRRSSALASYTNGPWVGNGLVLTSRQQNVNFSYNYNSGEKWSINGALAVQSASALGAFQTTFRSYQTGLAFNHRLWSRDFYATMGADYRYYDVGLSSNFSRNGSRVFAGFTYSPGTIPVNLR